jgi:chromosome segregation ATPase
MLATSEAASTVAHASISLLQKDVDDLRLKQEELITEHEANHLNLASKVEAREASLRAVEQEVSLQQACIAALQRAADQNAVEAADSAAAHTSAMRELEGQLAKQTEKTEKLLQDIAERESIIAQLRSASEDLKSALGTQAEQHAQLTQELSEREITAAGLRERVGELEEELAALLEQKSQLTQEVSSLEAAAKQSHAALGELAQQLAEQEGLNGTLAQQAADDQRTIEKLRTELVENTAELSAS